MKGKLTIKFYTNQDRIRGNRIQVFLRITYNRQKAEYATTYYIEPANWSDDNQRHKKNDMINSELSKIESQIREIKQKLEYAKKDISAKIIKDIFLEKDTVET